MRFLRYYLPVLIILSGFLLLLIEGVNENTLWGASSLWGAGLSVFFLNWLYRLGVAGDKDRDHEAAARRFLAEHGHWPDETPPKKRH